MLSPWPHIPFVLKPGPIDLPVFHLQFPPAGAQESAARPAQCWGTADIFISCIVQQACVRGQTEGAGVIALYWMCCGGFVRHRWTLCKYGHAVQTLCVCQWMYIEVGR